MEKDILIQGLRTRIGEDDAKVISDRTFDGVATEVIDLFADDATVTEDTWKLPVALLKQFAGQKRFDEKNFAEKFKADYAKEYDTAHEKDVKERIRIATEKALEEYKKTLKDEPGKDGNGSAEIEKELERKINEAVSAALKGITGADSEFGKMTAQLTKFVKSQEQREKTENLNLVKKELKDHLLALKATNEACIDDALDDIEYGEEPTFDGLKQSAITAYEKRYKRYYADGGKPFGGQNAGGAGSTSFVEERIKRLEKEAKEGAAYASDVEKTFK